MLTIPKALRQLKKKNTHTDSQNTSTKSQCLKGTRSICTPILYLSHFSGAAMLSFWWPIWQVVNFEPVPLLSGMSLILPLKISCVSHTEVIYIKTKFCICHLFLLNFIFFVSPYLFSLSFWILILTYYIISPWFSSPEN